VYKQRHLSENEFVGLSWHHRNKEIAVYHLIARGVNNFPLVTWNGTLLRNC